VTHTRGETTSQRRNTHNQIIKMTRIEVLSSFVVALCCLLHVQAMSLSTMLELEKLLEEFKRESSMSLEKKMIPRVIPGSENCAKSCRSAFQECMKKEKSEAGQMECGALFVGCFSPCFFVGKPHPDISICEPTCLNQYDKCVLATESKPEVFTCMNGRSACNGKCTALQAQVVEKRTTVTECDQKCGGLYKKCKDFAKAPGEFFICKANRMQCQRALGC